MMLVHSSTKRSRKTYTHVGYIHKYNQESKCLPGSYSKVQSILSLVAGQLGTVTDWIFGSRFQRNFPSLHPALMQAAPEAASIQI